MPYTHLREVKKVIKIFDVIGDLPDLPDISVACFISLFHFLLTCLRFLFVYLDKSH